MTSAYIKEVDEFESSVNLNDWGERMSKDDYHVIAYRILAYLYECLKEGNYPDIKYISHDSEAVNINLNYWEYIIRHLYADGYIEGVFLGNVVGRKTPMIKFEDLAITPLGIEYLQDNSAMARARKFLKDLKESVPGL